MTIAETEAQRARWERYRQPLGLTEDAGGRFALGGVAAHVNELDTRLLVLPSDPLSAAVSLDPQLAEAVKNQRPMPLRRGNYQWGDFRTTASAAVMPVIYGDEGWSRYLAVHRHGGIEFALSDGAGTRGGDRPPVFYLRHIVSHVWDALGGR